MNQQEQPQQEGKTEGGKVEKRFQSNLKKLNAVLAGNTEVFKPKLPNSDVSEAVLALIEDRRKKAKEDFKASMSALIDKKIVFDKEIDRLRKELENTILKKKEDFCKEMESVFGILESVDKVAADYAKVLSSQSTTETSEETEDNSEETETTVN